MHLDDFALRMVAPHAAAHGDALLVRRARHAEQARARAAAAPVEPAVRSPAQAVREVVVVVLRDRETIEHHLRRAVRHIVAIGIRDEEQLRRAHQPDAAAPDLHAGQHLHLIGEDLARLGHAVAVLVLEDDDAIAQPEIEPQLALGVGVVLRDPHPPARIPRHADRVLHLGLMRPHRRGETRRQRERLQRLLRRRRIPALLAIVKSGKIVGKSERGQAKERGGKDRRGANRHGGKGPRGAGGRKGESARGARSGAWHGACFNSSCKLGSQPL